MDNPVAMFNASFGSLVLAVHGWPITSLILGVLTMLLCIVEDARLLVIEHIKAET